MQQFAHNPTMWQWMKGSVGAFIAVASPYIILMVMAFGY